MASINLLRSAAALSLLGAPVYWLQGRRVRRRTPRLAEAPGDRHGSIDGGAPTVRLVGLGESPMAAVGLDDQSEGVIPCLAGRLAASGRRIEWRTAARSGATARVTLETLLPTIDAGPTHRVVIALGVNDCLTLSSPKRWREDLAALTAAVRDQLDPGGIIITGVPPMQHFPALPSTLSVMLGLRAAMLDALARRLAEAQPDLRHVPMDFVERPEGLFCRDGFHPNARAHALWAARLAGPAGIE